MELEIELWTPEYKASDLIIHYITPAPKVLFVALSWLGRGGLIVILVHILFVGQYEANSADPDQTLQNMASDQGLHYLITEYYIKI